jgi:hypothetical protein
MEYAIKSFWDLDNFGQLDHIDQMITYGAIQIICSTLGGRGVIQVVTKYYMGGGGWQKCDVKIFIDNLTSKG